MEVPNTTTRIITWKCTLCHIECKVEERLLLYPREGSGYVCICGRQYTLFFEREVRIEENTALDPIFQVKREGNSIEVRLAWEREKGCAIAISMGDVGIAVDAAIGRCWRLYREEILKRIVSLNTPSQRSILREELSDYLQESAAYYARERDRYVVYISRPVPGSTPHTSLLNAVVADNLDVHCQVLSRVAEYFGIDLTPQKEKGKEDNSDGRP